MKKFQFLFLLLPAYSAMSQMDMGMHSKMHYDSTKTFNTYRNIGVSYQKFNGLNDRIKMHPQYESMKEVMGTLGLGSIMQHNHFVAVNGLTVGYSMSGKRNKKSSSLGFIGLNADFGYNFFKKEDRVQLYPTVGVGVEGYRARFNKDVSAVPFDDVLQSNTTQNNIRSLTFMSGYFTYRFGLNLAVNSKDKSGAIGLQAGYTGGFNDSPWKTTENQTLLNAPNDKLSRLFANIFITKSMNWGKHNRM